MLTLDDVHVLHESPLRAGFWCEVIAVHPDYDRIFWIGSHPAGSPRLALRWLRGRAHDVADQLDRPFAEPVLAWLGDERERQHAMQVLAGGAMYDFNAFDQDGTRYVFSARPTGPPGEHPASDGVPLDYAWHGPPRSAARPAPPD